MRDATHGVLYPAPNGSYKGYAYYFGSAAFKFIAKPTGNRNYFNLFIDGKRCGWMQLSESGKVVVGKKIYKVQGSLKFDHIDYVFTIFQRGDHLAFI